MTRKDYKLIAASLAESIRLAVESGVYDTTSMNFLINRLTLDLMNGQANFDGAKFLAATRGLTRDNP